MSFLTGKASKSSSSNTNNGLLTGAYTPAINDGVSATDALTALLTGKGDTAGANQGYSNYLQLAGYQPAMTQLSKNITGQGAASGLLNSGATATRLQTQGTALNGQFFNNYLQQLAGLSGIGAQAGSIVGGAGSTSTSTGGTQGILGGLGSLASGVGSLASSGIFSDRRLKRNIRLVSREPDGLGLYEFRYVTTAKKIRGVMADEVAKLRPWAMGKPRGGYATVNYGAL